MTVDALPPPRIELLVYSPSPDPFHNVLATLLEPSPPLSQILVPQLHAQLAQLPPQNKPKSYRDLLNLAQSLVETWDVEDQAVFLSAHPRIGETKNLSALSGKEQASVKTPGEVLKRLSTLNSLYEESFPGLRYTTFVNGRTRAEIIPEIEKLLGLQLPAPSPSTPEPSLGSMRQRTQVRPQGTKVWRTELQRGMTAMWDIARARLDSLNVK